MVDVGCGTGALVPFLVEAGVQEGEVVGIDMSPEVRGIPLCFLTSCAFRQSLQPLFFTARREHVKRHFGTA